MATEHKPAIPVTEKGNIRLAKPEDAPECGRISHDAFLQINTSHGFPPDFPSADASSGLHAKLFTHPGFYCVVAEVDGKIVGSNCLDERTPIAGVGPITVDPFIQNRSVGRKLMQAVMDRAAERKFPGVRLVQAAFHNRSLSLYAKLGFDVREFLSVMQGPPINKLPEGYRVRPATLSDLEGCDRLCETVHGHDRSGELADGIKEGSATLAERHGRIVAYASALGFFGHAVGETTPDLEALIAAAPAFLGSGILVPARNAALFRWCLENGLKVVQPMTLMTIGLYNEPVGAYLPSVLY